MASRTAKATTIGVYMRAKRVMKLSLRDLLSAAFSTRSRILDAVDSPKALVVLTLSTPLRLTHPESTSSPGPMLRGTLSPVRATVSRLDSPSSTTPSRGTFSPGCMRIVSPGSTSSGWTVSRFPSLSTWALSGLMARRWAMLRRLLPSAFSSNHSPTWKKSITNTASGNCVSAPGKKPMASAPKVAMLIRKSSLSASPCKSPSAASFSVSQPTTR